MIVSHSADYEFNPIDCSFTATIRSQGGNAVEEKLQFFYNAQKKFYVADDFDLAKVTKRYFFLLMRLNFEKAPQSLCEPIFENYDF